jgi:hypothetical protein
MSSVQSGTVTTMFGTYRFNAADLLNGTCKVYPVDEEPLLGKQKILRERVQAGFKRTESLLTTKGPGGKCWAHDSMSDSFTHGHYDNAAACIENNEYFDLANCLNLSYELLDEFNPTCKTFCKDPIQQATMQKKKENILADLIACGKQLDMDLTSI